MKFFINELKLFYYTVFEDFWVDLITLISSAALIYWLAVHYHWLFFPLIFKIYFIFFYELFLWQLPFIYTIDLSYRYILTRFFNWLEAQNEVLRAWFW